MAEVLPRHLVIVRHGESEGDVRRAKRDQPLSHDLVKHPYDEDQTETGHKQSSQSGQWIIQHILAVYGIEMFDSQLTSPLIRTQQSARSLGLSGKWRSDSRLAERNRGIIQGMTMKEHEERYPESYSHMLAYPFHWTPRSGESILRVSHRFSTLVDDFMKSDNQTAIFMTHRDVIWAAHVFLDHMSHEDVDKLDTSAIRNGQVLHYTNVNPQSGLVDGSELVWKRSVTPWGSNSQKQTVDWLKL